MTTYRKVLILGFGPGWEDYPKDYDGEVWGINMAAVKCERVDRLFIADKLSEKTDIKNGFYEATYGEKKGQKIPITEEDYKKTIAEKKIPLVSCHPYPDVPTYEPYPLREIVKRFGTDYFANVISYAIAYAIFNEVHEIEFIGVRQGLLTEYAFHKGCVEFWIGMALGHGINIKITGDSHLLQTPDQRLYGFKKTAEELRVEGVL